MLQPINFHSKKNRKSLKGHVWLRNSPWKSYVSIRVQCGMLEMATQEIKDLQHVLSSSNVGANKCKGRIESEILNNSIFVNVAASTKLHLKCCKKVFFANFNRIASVHHLLSPVTPPFAKHRSHTILE